MFYSTQKNKARRIISPTVFTQFNYMSSAHDRLDSSADDRLDYVDARSYTMWVEVWDHNMQKRLNCGYVANGNKVKCDSLCEQLIKYLPEEQWMEVWACGPGKQIEEKEKAASYFREPLTIASAEVETRIASAVGRAVNRLLIASKDGNPLKTGWGRVVGRAGAGR